MATFSAASVAVAAAFVAFVAGDGRQHAAHKNVLIYVHILQQAAAAGGGGGKVSCFDMNVSFAHLSSLINIFFSFLFLSFFFFAALLPALSEPVFVGQTIFHVPMRHVQRVHPMWSAHTHTLARDGRVTKIEKKEKTETKKLGSAKRSFSRIPSARQAFLHPSCCPDLQTNKFQLKYLKNARRVEEKIRKRKRIEETTG